MPITIPLRSEEVKIRRSPEAYLVGGRWGTEAKAESGWVCCCECSSVAFSGSEAIWEEEEEESIALRLPMSISNVQSHFRRIRPELNCK